MKRLNRIILVLGFLSIVVSNNLFAQETEVVKEEMKSPFSINVDLVSSYVWRGVRFSGPALQPGVEYGKGGFAIGSWGSVGFDHTEAVNEADLYASYSFDFGFSLGISDYYFQSKWSEVKDSSSSHAYEINAAYETGGLSLSANYILNDSHLGAGSQGGDMYYELGYSFDKFDVFVGAGNGWHTLNGDFQVCNIGLSSSKELKFSEKFSLPVSGAVIFNPNTEILHIVGTISF